MPCFVLLLSSSFVVVCRRLSSLPEFASLLFGTRNYVAARDEFRRAARLNPRDPKIHYELGNSLAALGDAAAAAQAYMAVRALGVVAVRAWCVPAALIVCLVQCACLLH